MIGVHQRPGAIMVVSLRLLYLILMVVTRPNAGMSGG